MNYMSLYQRLCERECTKKTLEKIKEHYKSKINSKRKIGKINCLRYLIKILEKRDVINPEEFGELTVIFRLLDTNSASIENYRDVELNNDFQFVQVENRRPISPAMLSRNQGNFLTWCSRFCFLLNSCFGYTNTGSNIYLTTHVFLNCVPDLKKLECVYSSSLFT